MQSPVGSVVALSSAASTVFSIGMIFLGYWDIYEGGRWTARDYFVAGFALCGFVCLGLVPWLVTSPVKDPNDESKIRLARRMFLLGVSSMWLAVFTSLL